MSKTVFSILLLFACLQPSPAAEANPFDDGLTVKTDNRGLVTDVLIDGRSILSSQRSLFTLRDLSRAGTGSTNNLILNGGFETDEDGNGVPDAWKVSSDKNMVFRREKCRNAEGKYLISFVPVAENGSLALTSDWVAVKGGVRYRASAMVKAANGYLFQAPNPLAWQLYIYRREIYVNGIYITWYDENGTAIGPPELVAFPHCNAHEWKTISGEIRSPTRAAAARLSILVYLSICNEVADGLYVDDIRLLESPELDSPLEMSTVGNRKTKLTGRPKKGLTLSAELTTDEGLLEIAGELKDRKKRDGAYELSIRLPLELTGWRWWDDIRNSRSIGGTEPFENWVSADYSGRMPVTLYPLAAVEDGAVGLAVGLDLSRPQLARIYYDPSSEELIVRFYLGISPKSKRLKRKASFQVFFFTFDPKWGFRAALERFAYLQTASFTPRRVLDGYIRFRQGDYRMHGSDGPSVCGEEDGKSYYSAQYTATQTDLRVAVSSDGPPDYESIMDSIESDASDPAGDIIFNSSTRDANGDFALRYVKVPRWDLYHWGVSFATCPDPNIRNGFARYILNNYIQPAFEDTTAAGAVLDGVQFDNFMSNPTANLNRSHLRWADLPLTFDINTYQPARHTLFSAGEDLHWLRMIVSERYGENKCFSINGWGVGTVQYLMQFIDAYGMEGSPRSGCNWSVEILDYRRTLAYQKPLCFAIQDDDLSIDEARRIAALAKLYAIQTIKVPKTTGWDPEAESLLEEHNDVVQKYMHLGWEPITAAVADRPQIMVERFGDDPDRGIALVAYNSHGEPNRFKLSIDCDYLGFRPDEVELSDLVSGATLSLNKDKGKISVTLKLSGGCSAVLMLVKK